MSAANRDPRQTILSSPLSLFQKKAILVTILLYALDGFDVLAVTYAAPGFLMEWNLSRAQLGVALSAGLAGMAVGAFFVAPLADAFGRRPLIFACLLIMASGMLASAWSYSLYELALWRLLTGIGIGAMVCIINPLGAEYANRKRRDLVVGLMAVGFPIGGTLGGLVAAYLLAHYDWRAIFIFGGISAILMLPLVYIWLLEPVAMLIDKPSAKSLAKVNQFLLRSGFAEVNALPAPQQKTQGLPLFELFRAAHIKATLHIASLYSLYMVTVYFFLSWTPQLIFDIGFSQEVSAAIAVSRDLAGIVGGVCLGYAAYKLGLKRLSLAAILTFGLAVVLFSVARTEVSLYLVAALAGFSLYAGMVGLNATVVRTFATHVRASGSGFVIGCGRVASAMAPLLGGWLFTNGLSRLEVCILMSLFAIVAAVLLIFFRVKPIVVD
jgi:benzoate transport